MTPSEEKSVQKQSASAEERANARLAEIAENAEDYPAKAMLYASELRKAILEAETLRLTNQRLEAEVETLKEQIHHPLSSVARPPKE